MVNELKAIQQARHVALHRIN